LKKVRRNVDLVVSSQNALTAMVEQWHKAERDALDRQKLSLNGLLTEYAKVPDSW
jgi:hypothetical protein